MNEILWHDRARKQLKKIPAHYREAIHEHVDKLNVFPEHQGLDIKELKNHHAERCASFCCHTVE
jgi:mRNA-degrading endonuclease RelE of RelBE toxin-antitoxin system